MKGMFKHHRCEVRIANCKGMDGRTKRRLVEDRKRAQTRGFAIYVRSMLAKDKTRQAGCRRLGCQHPSSELSEVPDGSFHDSARRLAGSHIRTIQPVCFTQFGRFRRVEWWMLGRQGFLKRRDPAQITQPRTNPSPCRGACPSWP